MNNSIKTLLAAAILLSSTIFVKAQNSLNDHQLDSIIQVCISRIDEQETVGNMMWSANMMERVVKLNNTWSSNYYLCYFYLLVAMEMEQEDQKMVYYNSFMKQYEVADEMAGTNQEKSEMLTLLAFLKIDLLTTDPLKYGKDLSGEILVGIEPGFELGADRGDERAHVHARALRIAAPHGVDVIEDAVGAVADVDEQLMRLVGR